MVNISSDKMQHFISTARAHKQKRLVMLHQRRKQGLEIAKTAAEILKNEFAAARVVVFGSLLREDFHETSDIDLAVWGLPEKLYFKAVGRLLSLSAFDFDLVEIQFASPEILAAIAQGKEL